MTKLRVYVDGSFNPATYNWGAGSLIIDEDDRTLDEIIDSDFDHYGSRQIVGECFSTINALTKIYNDYLRSTKSRSFTIIKELKTGQLDNGKLAQKLQSIMFKKLENSFETY